MRSNLFQRFIGFAAFAAFVAVLASGVYTFGFRSGVEQLAQRGRSDLALASDRLTSELQSFRELASLIVDHPVTERVLGGGTAGQVLSRIADKSGALEIAISRINGQEIAVARGDAVRDDSRPGFQRAMDGALGVDHQYSERFGRRVFIFTAPVFSSSGPVIGAVSVTVDIEMIEASWRGDRPAVFFTDDQSVVFVSNRSELVFRSQSGDILSAISTDEYRAGDIGPFFKYATRQIAGHEVWDIDGGRYLPAEALHITLQLPTVGLVGEALVDISPARQIAGLQAAAAAALVLAFGAMLYLATLRRLTLAEANRKLEGRVLERTAELEAVATDLRHEVEERKAAEARLKKAQDNLVQAGKLSALGQMSAGISHELNQPLMAIRSFAENAEMFLERGKPERAAQNLDRISELARRMGRIIKNLRAFARQENEPLADVDLGSAIEATLEMAAAKAHHERAQITWRGLDRPIKVRAGEVRLQQVLLNLISNAIDAQEGQEAKQVEIHVVHASRVVVSIRDHGPGIDEPEKIFDPFYSTKKVGAAEGMGLGLSISYGLVQSFGGAIRGRNHPDGGAVFTIELDAAKGQGEP
ncbi:sensor histidine kinase [Marivivens donghaensis]|uniref:histidine kinase n=1 Tax=Marivivens donghaensis TaxID=1699413 RepID=A0ABX0VYF5_9RHOB|nr:ATP-binding protein [Marivivens donghaensis]NIY73133.1 sensor histidine kinase [Marivivens donghaensis]